MVQKVRIRVSGSDAKLVDQATDLLVERIKRGQANIAGPIPEPVEKRVGGYIHKRQVDLLSPSPRLLEALRRLKLPVGVDIAVES